MLAFFFASIRNSGTSSCLRWLYAVARGSFFFGIFVVWEIVESLLAAPVCFCLRRFSVLL